MSESKQFKDLWKKFCKQRHNNFSTKTKYICLTKNKNLLPLLTPCFSLPRQFKELVGNVAKHTSEAYLGTSRANPMESITHLAL